jgi:hypothetical protein
VGLLDRLRRLIWRAEEASNELEYTALDAVHHAEDAVDDRTGGRFYDALEKTDAEAEEVLEKLNLDERDDTEAR